MKKSIHRIFVLALGMLVIATTSASAEESSGSVAFWEKTKVTGSVDVNYNYNFNRPTITGSAPNAASGVGVVPAVAAGNGAAVNSYRSFDNNANSFNVALVDIALENSPNDWVTFRTDLDFGQNASLFHSAGLSSAANGVPATTTTPTGSFMTEYFDLQQAYVILKAASVGNGLSFKIGKFVTMHGAEVIEASANLNASRSFLFSYAIPFTHTGIIASYPFADWITLDAGVVNGWNNTIDNNNGKTIHGMFTIKPYDKVTWNLGGTWGPETAGTSSMYRYLLDSTITYAPSDLWSVSINYDAARDSGLTGGGKGFADWQGVALYVHTKPFDFFGLTLRGEYFKDLVGTPQAGGNLPTVVPALTASDKLFEATLTSHFYLADGLDLRFEYRHDHGNNVSFLRTGGPNRKFQDTIASQLVYAF